MHEKQDLISTRISLADPASQKSRDSAPHLADERADCRQHSITQLNELSLASSSLPKRP